MCIYEIYVCRVFIKKYLSLKKDILFLCNFFKFLKNYYKFSLLVSVNISMNIFILFLRFYNSILFFLLFLFKGFYEYFLTICTRLTGLKVFIS